MTHIFYYSWSGKTRTCAEAAARMLSCGITEILERIPRKKSILGFLKSGYEASIQRSSQIMPLPDKEVDMIVLAFPIWAGKIPPAMNTALQTLNFKDRKVLVINTMGGESDSFPGQELARSMIMQRGGLEVSFIRIATGRSSEVNWEHRLRTELKRLNFID